MTPAELAEVVEIYRILLRWDAEAAEQRDDIRTAAEPPAPR